MMKAFIQIFNSIAFLIKLCIKLVLLGIFMCFLTAGFDYLQVKNGDFPTFVYDTHMNKRTVQEFKGVFHRVYRTIYASPRESFKDSSHIEYQIFSYKVPIVLDTNYNEKTVINTSQKETCGVSELYYADLDIKVYTYCLNDIKYNDTDLSKILENDNQVIEDITSHLDYLGILNDKTTLEFKSKVDKYTNDGLKMYRCHKTNINDIYIGPREMSFHNDFCTYKNDDFKFIYQVTDETPSTIQPNKNEKGEEVPEVFYEDSINRYEFKLPKSNYVFITTPEVRGKAATKMPLIRALTEKVVSIDEVKEKGLVFDTINKEEERKRKEEEARKKLEEEQKKKETEQNQVKP